MSHAALGHKILLHLALAKHHYLRAHSNALLILLTLRLVSQTFLLRQFHPFHHHRQAYLC